MFSWLHARAGNVVAVVVTTRTGRVSRSNLRQTPASLHRSILTDTTETTMAKAKSPIPPGLHAVTPQLTMENAANAIEWYKKALGAEEVTRALGPGGKVIHATIRVGDSLIMLNDDLMGGNTAKAHNG